MNVKVKTAVATAMTAAALVAAPVAATSPGQLAGGVNVFKVKDVTQNGAYSTSLSTPACGDEIEYSVYLHNMDYGSLSNVTVRAALGSNSTVNVTTDLGGVSGTSGAVTVALGANQSLAYENGSTELFNGSGNLISNLPDGVTAGGVNIGTIDGSTTEFVNFKAKVNCPVTPETPTPTPTPTPAPAPTTLPQTGADGLAGLAGIGGTGAIGYGVMAYRRSKQALADKLRNRK